MTNLPLADFAQNRIWIAVVQLATELTAWMQMLALTGTDARRWEPQRLRLRRSPSPGPSPADPAEWGCTCPVMPGTGSCSPPPLNRLHALPAPT